MEDIADITPSHKVVSLARKMIRDAESSEAVAGFYVIMTKDGILRKKDLLWALEVLKGQVLEWAE